MKLSIAKVLAFSITLGVSVAAQADILVNTFGGTAPGFIPGSTYTVAAAQWMDKPFTVAGSYTFSQIEVAVRFNGLSDQFTVSLHSETAGQPGAVLESFVVSNTFGDTNGHYFLLNSVTNAPLSVGNYHVTIKPTDGSSTGGWCFTNDGNTSTQMFSSNGGASYSTFTSTNGAITVHGNLVPEPASLAVLGLGALVLVRRRR